MIDRRLPTHEQQERLCELLEQLDALSEELPAWVVDSGRLGSLFCVLDCALKDAYELPSISSNPE